MFEVKTGTAFSYVFNSSTTPSVFVYTDGVANTGSVVVTPITGTFYRLTLTPMVSGKFQVFNQTQEVVSFVSIERTSRELIVDIFDESLGTWEWDKSTKALTLYRSTGEVLRVFEVDDTLTNAYRS